jgi:hypothetical protein
MNDWGGTSDQFYVDTLSTYPTFSDIQLRDDQVKYSNVYPANDHRSRGYGATNAYGTIDNYNTSELARYAPKMTQRQRGRMESFSSNREEMYPGDFEHVPCYCPKCTRGHHFGGMAPYPEHVNNASGISMSNLSNDILFAFIFIFVVLVFMYGFLVKSILHIKEKINSIKKIKVKK